MDCLIVFEDAPSEAILTRLVTEYAPTLSITARFAARGFGNIKSGFPRFRNASNAVPHIVLTDLDQYPCASALLRDWNALPLHRRVFFRIAVREIESWLLADSVGIASMLSIDRKKIPTAPDDVANPKQTLVNLSRRSKSRRFSAEFAPATSSSAQIGPMYNDYLCRFIRANWNVENARARSPSLQRCILRLQDFAVTATQMDNSH